MGATRFPDEVDDYLKQELKSRATMGPFLIPPFLSRIGISPISTRAKKDSDKRRIILDLSFPEGSSVNNGINKDWYCGEKIELKYPTIDTLAKRVLELKQNGKVLLWKRDLSKYFRQIPGCPLDYSLIGMRWGGYLFFDRMMPMGLRSAAYVAQRVSSSIVYIHKRMDFWSTNYLDDFGSAENEDKAWSSFTAMERILRDLGVEEASNKAVAPCTRMDFLGNMLDTEKCTIEVSQERMNQLTEELQTWLEHEKCTKK